jgi:hypothetical protein
VIQKHNELRFRSDLFLSSADQNSEMMDISTEQKKIQSLHGSNTVQKEDEKEKEKRRGKMMMILFW